MARGAEPASVGEILKDIGKKYGPIGSMSNVVSEVQGLTTGNLAVDYLTGVGGLPLGRIIEMYGVPSAGKTTVALQAAAELQRNIIAAGSDEHILYMDFERALDLDYANALGIDTAHPSFIVAQPAWLEDGAEIVDRLLGTGRVRLTIFDSVAEMAPKDLEFGVRTAAMERARLMNSLLQRVNAMLHETNSCAVFLNHLVEAIGMNQRPGLPPQETSPGGKGLKFYASLRLSFKIVKQIKGKAPDGLSGDITEQVIATHVKVKCTKNKVGIPLREAEVRVRLGAGLDNVWSALQVLTAHNQIRRGSAGWYRFNERLGHPSMSVVSGLPSIQGEAAVLAFADEHPEWGRLLVMAAQETIALFSGTEVLALANSDEDIFGEEDEA